MWNRVVGSLCCLCILKLWLLIQECNSINDIFSIGFHNSVNDVFVVGFCNSVNDIFVIGFHNYVNDVIVVGFRNCIGFSGRVL